MSVIYDNDTKADRMTATRDKVGGGALELLSASDAVLASFTLTAAGGTVSGDVLTFAFDSTSASGTTAAGTGTDATKAQITDGTTARVTGLTVGTSAADVIVDNVSIAEGQGVNLVGAQTITHAA